MNRNFVKSIPVGIFVALFLVFAATVSATNWHVYPGGSIQAAVDSASPGDTIIVHVGTYYETVIIKSDDHHLSLKGQEGTVIFGANAGIELQGGTHHIEISGFEITISNPVWDNPGISAWTNTWDPDYAVMSHITIHHNYIHGCYKGILFGAWVWSPFGPGISHHNITIHHNVVSDNVDLGISFWGVSESNVHHNIIKDNGNGAGPLGLGNGLVFFGVSDSNADHNKIHGNDVVGLGIYGGSTDNNFSYNDVRNNDNLGILLTGWNAPTTENIFIHNDARNNPSWDIREFTTSAGNPAVYGNIWVKNKYDDANPDPPQ